jgi:hypothetical protein
MNPHDLGKLQPPDDLEARVIARLRDAGLLAPAITQEVSMKTIHLYWSLAAAVLLAVGVAFGMQLSQQTGDEGPTVAATPPTDTRTAFALMLYEDAGYQAPVGEDDHAARVAEYGGWARKLAGEGRLVDGAELLNQGVLLHRERPRADGVPGSDEGLLAGYFVIRAASLEEAERVAAECPHLKYGGTVSVRPTGA